MAGSNTGGQKARDTNRKRHGSDFYAKIGAKGGRISRGGGFASDDIGDDGLTGWERASVVGKKGGLKSRRKKSGV